MPGQSTSVHVALARNNPVQSIEITPSTGIAVSDLKFRDLNQGSVWWEFTVTVARDAAPGPRALVAVQQNGRTAPVSLLIPDHVPNISNLRGRLGAGEPADGRSASDSVESGRHVRRNTQGVVPARLRSWTARSRDRQRHV
jgi:hypothetical protein